MVSFGKATLFLSIMSSVMDFTLGEETQVMMQKTRNLKGASGGSQSKGSKKGGFPPDQPGVVMEAWRRSRSAWYYRHLGQIQSRELIEQLAGVSVIPVGGTGITLAYEVAATVGVDACVPGNPGIGRHGEFTETACYTLKKLIEFWSLDPAIDSTQVARVQMQGVKGKILADTDALKAVFANSPTATDEFIQQLQEGVQMGLPDGFDNPLLTSGGTTSWLLTNAGTMGKAVTDPSGASTFQEYAIASLSLGDGFMDRLAETGIASNFLLERVIVDLFPFFLMHVAPPVPRTNPTGLAPGTPIGNDFINAERDVMRITFGGYFFAHMKGTLYFDTLCDMLETPLGDGARRNCGMIVGAKLAAMDGEMVNATRVIEYVRANRDGILSADPSICPTPPGCFDG
uniref:PNPLA domain-containing protein n=1 Tax=Craspedostauros australis TaxID=1486917 RepID=A0A7R9WLX8_9STRA|mmetsp:Transcript_10932/g.30194  ORF Transcript_10932/g.30194 Transcript_10932/m.30194 type:complete len:400 (+) Transcript_10932:146-1345(+)